MIFLQLVLQNFGPYQGRQEINLRPETNNETRPIILFGGMNGGGKTTLMDAIRLALYGQRAQCSTRGNLSYPDFLTQCVNRNTPPTEKARIELAFEIIEDGKPKILRIVRYWTPDPKDGKDTLGILENDEWKDDALTNTWDQYIENLLPIGISSLFLFDGEQVKELAEMETPPPVVVEAIQSLLGLELSERLSADLDILASRKRKELATTKELATLEEIEQKLKQQNEELDGAKQELGSLNGKLERAENKQREAQDKFLYEGGKIASDRSRLEKQQNYFIEQRENVREVMRELAAGALPLALISPILTQAQFQAEKESRQQQAKIAQNILKERDNKLLDYITKLSLDNLELDKIKNFIALENQQLEEEIAVDTQPWLLADQAEVNQLNNVLYAINTAEFRASEKQAELEKLEIEIEALERQINSAASPEAYQQLKDAVITTQNEAAKVKAAHEAVNRRCEELKRAIAQIKKELESYADESLKSANNQHIINSIAKVKDTLKLFKEKLTLKKLNKLEMEVTECFRYLLHKSDLVHRVAIDTKTFALSIYDPQGQPVPKHRLSAGEKQLLAIAFLWGLARVSGRHLPVAIDTPLGRLDSSHRQNLVERYFPTASHQVILLSTDTEIGKVEVEQLRENSAIAREYLLKYDSVGRQTVVELGYFW